MENVTRVTVYSSVELFANGESLGVTEASDHFFYFDVPNAGETELVAIAGECRDESHFRKVETFNEDYRLKEKNGLLNWFDITEPEGRLSLNAKFGDIMETLRGKILILALLAKKMPKGGKGGQGSGFGFDAPNLGSMMGIRNISFTKEELLKINAQRNQIKAPKNNSRGSSVSGGAAIISALFCQVAHSQKKPIPICTKR